ncbi:MAG: heme o synthase [Mariprofundales bacterium]
MHNQHDHSASLELKESNVVADYINLGKPGIVGLSLVAALTGIYFANDGMLPDWSLIIWTFLTLGIATAGSCMLNNVYDRDIDALMGRTNKRALAAGRLNPQVVLPVAVLLIAVSLATMVVQVNLAAAIATGLAVFGYSVIYTIAKRRTPWANQLGGIAGAAPPLIGYVAVTGYVDIYAFALFFIMVVWQQPHALSLALKYREDYARAKVPVIPVAHGVDATKKRIMYYNIALLPVVALPYFIGMAGIIYLASALLVTSIFLSMSIRFLSSDKQYDMRLFFFSIVHLIVVFGVMIADSIHKLI